MEKELEEFEPCLLISPFRKHTLEEIDRLADLVSKMGYKVQKKNCKKPCNDRLKLIEEKKED